jgi:hypothetical protein
MSIGIRIAGLNPWNQIRLNYQQIRGEGFCVIFVATVVTEIRILAFVLFIMILTLSGYESTTVFVTKLRY